MRATARSLNLLRTHYTPSQRALFAARWANATKADAHYIGKSADVVGQRQAAKELGVGIREAEKIIPKFRDDDLPVSERRAAREAGVDPSAVNAAKRILRDGATSGPQSD